MGHRNLVYTADCKCEVADRVLLDVGGIRDRTGSVHIAGANSFIFTE